MQKTRLALLLPTILFLARTSSAQWTSFVDETSTRLSLSSVSLNDDREKDIATADLDQNGLVDVVIVRKVPFSTPGAAADVLLLNNGGVLEDQTATFAPDFLNQPTDARDVFILDFDEDGWEDVVIANTFEQPHKFYRNLAVDAQNNWLGLVEESWRIPR